MIFFREDRFLWDFFVNFVEALVDWLSELAKLK